jgi:hypothetical protein
MTTNPIINTTAIIHKNHTITITKAIIRMQAVTSTTIR